MKSRTKIFLIEGIALAVVCSATAALALMIVFVVDGINLELGAIRSLGLASLAWCIVAGISFVKISKYANRTRQKALWGGQRPSGDNNELKD